MTVRFVPLRAVGTTFVPQIFSGTRKALDSFSGGGRITFQLATAYASAGPVVVLKRRSALEMIRVVFAYAIIHVVALWAHGNQHVMKRNDDD
jgi:hypothetical protein